MVTAKSENLSFAKIVQLCGITMSIPSTEIFYYPHSMMLLVVVLEILYLAFRNIGFHILTLSEVTFVFNQSWQIPYEVVPAIEP